jgi:hypothetical protein
MRLKILNKKGGNLKKNKNKINFKNHSLKAQDLLL